MLRGGRRARAWLGVVGRGRQALAALGLGLLLALGPALGAQADQAALQRFADQLGLHDPAAFVETVTSLRTDGRLPERYLTKRQAEALGWRPGTDLCSVAPGHMIGGDRFGNRERRLPEARGRSWREADIDSTCRRRGARRLVFSSDGLIEVTLDHYETFEEVPR